MSLHSNGNTDCADVIPLVDDYSPQERETIRNSPEFISIKTEIGERIQYWREGREDEELAHILASIVFRVRENKRGNADWKYMRRRDGMWWTRYMSMYVGTAYKKNKVIYPSILSEEEWRRFFNWTIGK